MACSLQINKLAQWKPRLVCCLCLGLLVACQPERPDRPNGKGLTLAAEKSAAGSTVPRKPPRPTQLQLAIPSGNLDTLDFLAVSGCAVQVTIGKRNSSLGRTARPSQRLLLELEFLQLAPQCITYQHQQGKVALAQALQQAWDLKRQQLPGLIFNATLGSSEYHSLWRAPPASGDYPEGTSNRVIAALLAIHGHARRWLAGDFRADNRALELLLNEVATGVGGAPDRRYREMLPALTPLEEMLDTVLPEDYRAWQRIR